MKNGSLLKVKFLRCKNAIQIERRDAKSRTLKHSFALLARFSPLKTIRKLVVVEIQ